MASRKSRKRQTRRDRRKAKESGFAREGTKNPKKVGHHMSFSTFVGQLRKQQTRD